MSIFLEFLKELFCKHLDFVIENVLVEFSDEDGKCYSVHADKVYVCKKCGRIKVIWTKN